MAVDRLPKTTGARRCATKRWTTRLAALAAAAIAVLGAPRPASAIKTGDLLVVTRDTNSSLNQVVAVDPDTGAVTEFSPRRGSGTDLLNDGSLAPVRDVAADPEGEVFVTYEGKLIEIDPATGAQTEIRGFIPQILGSFPLDLGDSTAGIAVSPIAPSAFDRRTIFVASDGDSASPGAVYEVDRSGLTGTGASIFASYPSGYENAYGHDLTAEDLGGGDIGVWVGSLGAVLAGGKASLQPFYTEPAASPQGEILGARESGGVVYLSRGFGFLCSDYPDENGLYAYAYNFNISAYILSAFATGGDLSCPGAIAAVANPFTLYVATDVSAVPGHITRVAGLQSPQVSLVATLSGSKSISGIAVYVPEPAEGFEHGAALAALLGLVLASAGWRRAGP